MIHAPPITNTNAQGTPSVSEGATLTANTRAEQLLVALAAADFDTTKILATGAFTIIEIADLTADETFQRRQAALMSLKKTALTLQAIDARQACMKALKHVVETTEDLVEQRRAATALLRATTAPLIPTTERQPRAPKEKDKPDPPPDPPEPTHTPDPDYSASDVVHIIAHAARNAAEPENAGLATIAAFAAETATIDDQPFAPEDPEDPDALNDSIDTLAHSSLAILRNTNSFWPSNNPRISDPTNALPRLLRQEDRLPPRARHHPHQIARLQSPRLLARRRPHRPTDPPAVLTARAIVSIDPTCPPSEATGDFA